jgi:thioredoxin-related protein
MKKIIGTFLFTLLISNVSFSQENIIWHTDVNEALEVAFEENKKILLFFTGSDWCGWCIKLQKEVFKTSKFEKWSDGLVLVELDYPRRTAQTEKIKAQNNQLQQMFGVRGYPTVLFINPKKMGNGKINLDNLGKTGYVHGGPQKWIEVANAILKKTI